MNADKRSERLNAISERIIGCAFEVSNTLGTGFLEKVYENALTRELNMNGLNAIQQKPLLVRYKDVVVGEYVADIIVENTVIIEVKAWKALDQIHQAQCMNHLKTTDSHQIVIKRCC